MPITFFLLTTFPSPFLNPLLLHFDWHIYQLFLLDHLLHLHWFIFLHIAGRDKPFLAVLPPVKQPEDTSIVSSIAIKGEVEEQGEGGGGGGQLEFNELT